MRQKAQIAFRKQLFSIAVHSAANVGQICDQSLLDGNFNLAQHEKLFVNGVIFVTLIFMVEAFAARCTRLCLVINSRN